MIGLAVFLFIIGTVIISLVQIVESNNPYAHLPDVQAQLAATILIAILMILAGILLVYRALKSYYEEQRYYVEIMQEYYIKAPPETLKSWAHGI
jgi:uncharacterized protein YxeA